MTAPTNIITITGINEDTTSDNSSADDFITKDKDGLTVTAMLSAALQPTETLQYSNDGGTTWINIPAENITNDTNVSYVDNALTTSTRIQFRVVNDAGENGSVTEQTIIIYETKNAEGTDGADPITGTSENDWIDAGSGDDIVNGAGGDDTVIGGLGADTITGGSGDDYIDGGDADDTLDGGAGNDTIYGGAGNDTITGDSGTPEASLSEAITLSGISAEDKWNSATVNLNDGRSLVVWSNTTTKEFQGRLVNAEGTAEGSVFTIFNTGTEGIDRAFELSTLSDGRVLLGYTGGANDKGTLHVFNPDDPTNSTTNSTIYLTPDGSATLTPPTYSTYASFVTTNDTIIATGTSVHGQGKDIIRIYQKQQDGSYSHSNHQELTTDIEWTATHASYKHSNIIELENGQVLASIGSVTNYNIEGFLFHPETITNEFDFTKISLTESNSDDETTATEFRHDSVALDNGGFAVVYGQSSDNYNESSNNIDQIYLRFYDENGNTIAPAHKISGEQTSEGYELGDNKYPAIAKTSDGNLAIAWVNDGYYMDTNNVNWDDDWSTAGIKTRFVNLDSSDNFVSLEDIVTVQLFGSYQYVDNLGNEQTAGPDNIAYENVSILNAGEGKVTVTWAEKNHDSGDATDDANGTYNDTFIKSVTVESAASASSNDVIYGEAGEDNISGGYGDDQLDGGADADTIDGDSGNDTLIGGAGSDTLTGGAGDDVFDVTSGVTSETSHKDTITDFGTGADTLDLSTYYNATSLAAWNAANPTKIYQSALDWLRADFDGSDDPEGDAAAKTLQLGRSDANETGNTVFFSNNITSADLTEANTKVSADDTTAPTIASVTLADGIYGIGDPVPLTITATNNEPGLTLSSTTFNGQTLTDITDNGDGTYSATYTVQEGDPDLSDGGNASANLAFTDPANNTGPAITSVALSGETIDATAPEAPTLNQVTSDNLINASEAEAGFNITGTGEPGATITITLEEPQTLAGGNTATVQNDGTWSIPVTQADVTAMGEGDTDLALTQTDLAGNTSNATTQTITVETTTRTITPAILSAEMSFGEVLTPDEMDEQADLTVHTANIADGDTISISTDGVDMTPALATVEANEAVFSVSAEELQSLRDGTYEFTLTVTDSPSVQHKQSFKKTGDVEETENDDTITPTSGPNNTPYADGDGDKVDGDDGNDDYIDAKGGNDIVDGGQGNDIIHGGTGNDILNGGVGDDTLDGGSGNDLLRGDTGNDSLKGGDGQDDLQGGDGDDSLDGGDGNDVLDGGTGADTLTGGAGQDEFKVDAGDTVADFDIDEDKIDLDDIYNFDTLALWNEENPTNSFSNPLQWLKSDQAGNDGLTGLDTDADPINLMNNGAFINASDLTQENTGVVCYGAATRIETIEGPKAIERLKPGDLVKTGGNGHHPIRWIRGRTIFHAELQAHPNLVPVRIKAGAMGKGLPKRDLIVSQHHRMVVSSDLSSAETGSKEIFISAKDLIGVPGIEIAIDLTEITYWHFICDQHQVVFAEGAASESLYTGPEALKMLGAEARAEIYQIFPELRDAPPTMLQNRPVQS